MLKIWHRAELISIVLIGMGDVLCRLTFHLLRQYTLDYRGRGKVPRLAARRPDRDGDARAGPDGIYRLR
jgi:hypothetical protein